MSQKDPIVPEGWTIQSTSRHRTIGDWVLFFLSFLFSLVPAVGYPSFPPADVTYTMRRDGDGKIQTIKLPGDHSADALAETLRLLESEPSC